MQRAWMTMLFALVGGVVGFAIASLVCLSDIVRLNTGLGNEWDMVILMSVLVVCFTLVGTHYGLAFARKFHRQSDRHSEDLSHPLD
jgi:predicted membrane protein